MEVVVFQGAAAQATGLQYRRRIDPDTLFVFPDVPEGAVFHSRNVPESFDIAFLTADFTVLEVRRVEPPYGVARSPRGTRMAVEAKGGTLEAWDFVPGKVAFYGALPSSAETWPS